MRSGVEKEEKRSWGGIVKKGPNEGWKKAKKRKLNTELENNEIFMT